MNWVSSVRMTVMVLLTAGAAAHAQPTSATNPFDGNPDAIKAGTALYRVKCADCHGMDARGLRSPDLTQIWASGRTNDGLHRTIRYGVSGTEMPSFPPPRTTDEDIWRILAYLRTLAAPAPTEAPRGNAENGARLFRVHCASCHRVNGAGGRLGPDLSRIGLSRSRQTMMRQIRGSVEDFRFGYEPVTFTTATGQTVQGAKKNEDLFSVQIMDTRERIQGYTKSTLRGYANGTRSLMPVYGPERLSETELDDLLKYLDTLRGFDPLVR